VIGHLCGGGDESLPDAGESMCCMGAAVWGPQSCTCWRPVYDVEQQPPRPGASDCQPRPCADCAYRPGSPERADDEQVAGDQATLDRLVVSGQPFYCHAGMRREIALVHEPTGVRVDRGPESYAPPTVDGVPFRADGAPALLCGGWAALRLAWLQRGVKAAGE
jgi:hypothetical protein